MGVLTQSFLFIFTYYLTNKSRIEVVRMRVRKILEKENMSIFSFLFILAFIMECITPFTDYISNCQTSIQVNAHLTPNTSYIALIRDKFNKNYDISVTTDSDGNFSIDVDDLPAGLLNSYGGTFALSVVQLYTAAPVNLNMKKTYEEIFFTVEGGTYEKDNIGDE